MKAKAFAAATLIALGTIGSTGQAHGAAAQVEHFTAVATTVGGPEVLVAAGPIAANGTAIPLDDTHDTFSLPAGTLAVTHKPTSSKDTYDKATCVDTYTETGTYVVTGGTKAYAHAKGSGTYRALVIVQGCDPDKPPTSFVLVIEAQGPLKI